MQQVYLGKTLSGKWGLFTGGWQALRLSAEELDLLEAGTFEAARRYVYQRWNFDLQMRPGQTEWPHNDTY